MNIRFSFDQRFEYLFGKIKEKHGEDILRFAGVHPEQLDLAKFTRDFLFTNPDEDISVSDLSVDSNANVDDKSVVAFDHESAKSFNKFNALHIIWEYILKTQDILGTPREKSSRLANSAIENIITCGIYLNDSHFVHKAYCYAFDLTNLVYEGMPFVKKVHIGPPAHMSSYIDLIIQSVAFISNQIAGAASLPNLLLYMDYFIRKDYGERYWENPDTLTQVEQGFQSLVYSLNFSFRGSQSAFTNMSVYDKGFMTELFGHTVYPDGTKPDFDSIYKLQELYLDWFNRESQKQSFTFPVLTANMEVDEEAARAGNKRVPLDMSFVDMISEQNLPYGIQNFYAGEATSLSMCCRMRSSVKSKGHTYSLGTGSVSTGSHRVCNIPLPRIAIESNGNKAEFFRILKHRIVEVHAVLHAHREIIKEMIKIKGKLPLYEHHWMELSKQYSTVGIIGPYEACAFMGMDIITPEGRDFVVEIMDFINEENLKEQERWDDGREFNLELIPGEQANIKVCEADKMLFPSFFKNSKYKNIKLYANQFIPLPKKVPVWDRLTLQGVFDSRAQGGCILHINVDHRFRNKEQMKRLILSAVSSGVISFAVNHNIARCVNSHISVGIYTKCPECGSKIISNRTRVVGFNTEVSDWHKIRREEYKLRHFYNFTDEDPEEGFPEEMEATHAS